jgi:hypothetical protein
MPKATTTKKVTTKKVAAKKAVAKKVAKSSTSKAGKAALKPLTYSDDSCSFWVSDGQILNSLVALRDALSAMEKSVYAHHVTADKNDFANWVEAVLGDADCANALRQAKSPSGAKTVVVKFLKLYTY